MNTPSDLRSPYLPPNADLTQPPPSLPALQPHERSGAPKVFGVLSIIFASIMLLGSALGTLGTVASSAASRMGDLVPDADKAPDVAAMMQPLVKLYQGLGIECVMFFLMSALLLAIGIGQVRYRAWAQRWSVYWGAAGLAGVALLVAISLLVVAPAYGQMLEALSRIKPTAGEGQAPLPSMGALGGIFGGTFAVMSVIFYAPYPALMLMFFTRERVRASMTQ
jgi:hypothetical protein